MSRDGPIRRGRQHAAPLHIDRLDESGTAQLLACRTTATTFRCAKGGQFVLHTKALPGNPYDGHIPARVIEETQFLTGRDIERVCLDKGYRGHDAPKPLRVLLSG